MNIEAGPSILNYLRGHATSKQADCFASLLDWPVRALAQNLIKKRDIIEHIDSLAVLLTCNIVTQWGSEQPITLFLPIMGPQAQLLPEAIQTLQAQKGLAILSLSNQAELLHKFQFSAAWEYVITVSFPIDEEAIWVLPLNNAELQRHGGEVRLPSELGKLWDCC